MKIRHLNICIRKLVILFGIFFLPLLLVAQSSQKIITYLDENRKPVASEKKAVLVEERWKENGQWKARTLYADTRTLQADYAYADSTRNFTQGIYTEYTRNRKKIKQVTCNMGKNDGPFTVWLPDGTLIIKGSANGETVYGNIEHYEVTGKLKSKYTTDLNGNGTGIEYMVHTGFTGEGAIKKSRQYGVWEYKDQTGKKMMEVTYNDSGTIAGETCFDADGKQIKTGECISDRRPAFKGGAETWKKFLEKNLKYPKEARRAEIQGVVTVKFLVKADGTVANVKVIDAPDALLAEEAVRIISISPNWTPGIECNKVIDYTHVQNITFRLE